VFEGCDEGVRVFGRKYVGVVDVHGDLSRNASTDRCFGIDLKPPP